jgi:hypothetical protein
MSVEWRELTHFALEGWDGYTIWASCDHDGIVSVRRRMIHVDGTVHHKDLRPDAQGRFSLSLPQMKGVHNGGCAVTSKHTGTRVLAYAIDFVPFGAQDVSEACKYQALRIDEELPLSFDNVGWFEKGEANRRPRRLHLDHMSTHTLQQELDGEQFENVKYREYDHDGNEIATFVSSDARMQISTHGRVRYMFGDNGTYHYRTGSTDISGYKKVSMRKFKPNKSVGAHILVMHTFVGFPDELGHDVRVTTVDHINHERSDDRLVNLQYANRCYQSLNRRNVLQKYDAGCFDELPDSLIERASSYTPLQPQETFGELEKHAETLLRETPFDALQSFMRLTDIETHSAADLRKMASSIAESMFMFDYTDMEPFFERSNWVYEFEKWKSLDVGKMRPRERVKSIIAALNDMGQDLEFDTVKHSDVTMTRLRLLFNRVMMYHHHRAREAHITLLSTKKRKRDQ